MGINRIIKSILDDQNIPNNFTTGMGERIRQARIEAGLSLDELARLAYIRPQNVLQMIEDGQHEITSSELIYFANALDKSILYFFPERYIQGIEPSALSMLETELLLLFGKLSEEDQRKILAQIRALVDLEGKGK